MAGHDDVSRVAAIRLHDPVRQQSAGSRRSRRDLLQAQRAVADPGRERHGRLRHQPHAVRSIDARTGIAAGIPRRSDRPHQISHGGAGDAVRRQGPRVPAAAVYCAASERLHAERPEECESVSR